MREKNRHKLNADIEWYAGDWEKKTTNDVNGHEQQM